MDNLMISGNGKGHTAIRNSWLRYPLMNKLVRNTVVLVISILMFATLLVGCNGNSLNGTWTRTGSGDFLSYEFSGRNVTVIDTWLGIETQGTFSLTATQIEFVWTRRTHIDGRVHDYEPAFIETANFSRTENTIRIGRDEFIRR